MRSWGPEVIRGQNSRFRPKTNNLWTKKANILIMSSSCLIRRDAPKHTSMHDDLQRSRLRDGPSRLCCILVDVSLRVKHNGIVPTSPALFNCEFLAKAVCDLIWPHMVRSPIKNYTCVMNNSLDVVIQINLANVISASIEGSFCFSPCHSTI